MCRQSCSDTYSVLVPSLGGIGATPSRFQQKKGPARTRSDGNPSRSLLEMRDKTSWTTTDESKQSDSLSSHPSTWTRGIIVRDKVRMTLLVTWLTHWSHAGCSQLDDNSFLPFIFTDAELWALSLLLPTRTGVLPHIVCAVGPLSLLKACVELP